MFVPLDRMYTFLDQCVDDDVVIYQFMPHGSRKISDISQLKDFNSPQWYDQMWSVPMLMHDQESLYFDLYTNPDSEQLIGMVPRLLDPLCINLFKKTAVIDAVVDLLKHHNLEIWYGLFVSDKWLLCHSEKNSKELEKYQSQGAVGVYWWSHAVIARDWYRYSKVDRRLDDISCEFLYDFNVYNRAWSGTREYRLKFFELVMNNGLLSCTQIPFSARDQGIHYRDHIFKNPALEIATDLLSSHVNQPSSDLSADYSYKDYQCCAVDVVLETLFDDDRNHVTEKTLRPIACGKPFIMVSTPGSLQYLKEYGFKTFGDLIDESYDSIIDPLQRLTAVIDLMKAISKMAPQKKKTLFRRMHDVAKYNRRWFWSDKFASTIMNEFKTNYEQSYAVCKQAQQGRKLINKRKHLSKINHDYRRWLCTDNEKRTRKDVMRLLLEIKQTWTI